MSDEIKLSIDMLSEEQMQRVRQYLASKPNKPHRGINDENYGEYISVKADIKTNMNLWTGQSRIERYENVTFKLRDEGIMSKCTAKRREERNEVVQGLVSLLTEFLSEK